MKINVSGNGAQNQGYLAKIIQSLAIEMYKSSDLKIFDRLSNISVTASGHIFKANLLKIGPSLLYY